MLQILLSSIRRQWQASPLDPNLPYLGGKWGVGHDLLLHCPILQTFSVLSQVWKNFVSGDIRDLALIPLPCILNKFPSDVLKNRRIKDDVFFLLFFTRFLWYLQMSQIRKWNRRVSDKRQPGNWVAKAGLQGQKCLVICEVRFEMFVLVRS